MTKESGTSGAMSDNAGTGGLSPGSKGLGDIVRTAAEKFAGGALIAEIREHGSGHINDTFLVTSKNDDRRGIKDIANHGAKHHGLERFILQRLNGRVFRRPDLVMRNLRIFSEHALMRLKDFPAGPGRGWEIPAILPTFDLQDHWIDDSGSFWRAMTFIGNARSFDTVQGPDHAEEVGRALGTFHALVSDLPAAGLADTLEGFHVTPLYLARYDKVLDERPPDLTPEVRFCMDFIETRRSTAGVLEDAAGRGLLDLRVIHGDPKASNVLIDIGTGLAVAMVDLDTVKPGLPHYDLGDCLRSSCNPWGEEGGRNGEASLDIGLFRAVLRGYFSSFGQCLTESDRDYIFDAARLISFELGLRFFTDHLEGNTYFKIKRAGQNLSRAIVQFRLSESIESEERTIRRIIGGIL